MANVTIKDVDEHDLGTIALHAKALGLSTQEYLRRLIARDAASPMLPDELRELAAARREGRVPITMEQFNQARRSGLRTS